MSSTNRGHTVLVTSSNGIGRPLGAVEAPIEWEASSEELEADDEPATPAGEALIVNDPLAAGKWSALRAEAAKAGVYRVLNHRCEIGLGVACLHPAQAEGIRVTLHA